MDEDRTLSLYALGGLGEIGMNCLALEQSDDVLLVDCGVTFPASDLGVDVLHPRFDAVLERPERLRGVVLTHGHEDHVGALPYLLDAFCARQNRCSTQLPIWGPPHALSIARARLEEHGFERDEVSLLPTTVRQRFAVGSFEIEPIRVTHSIADATALAIRTHAGLVLATGDFKLDPTPIDGEITDEARLEELGREGVRLLLSDSTGIDAPGRTTSERKVSDTLEALVAAATTRVFIGMFASNVQRLASLGAIARRAGRRICLLGRSVETHVRAAHEVGRLAWPSDLVVSPDVAAQLPRRELLVVAGGTQAEHGSALSRIGTGSHPALRIEQGDVVILSSRIIPGNDRAVFEMMGNLLRLGAQLVTRASDPTVHASGHAHREEQARMIELTRPRAFVPVHGTLHHLVRHAELARVAGVPDVAVIENGEVLRVRADGPVCKSGRVPVGRVATFGGEELADEVVRERARMARAGSVVVALVLDRRGDLAAPPEIVTRGVLPKDDEGVVRDAGRAAGRALRDSTKQGRFKSDVVAEAVRLAVRRTIEEATGQRPVVSVAITRL